LGAFTIEVVVTVKYLNLLLDIFNLSG